MRLILGTGTGDHIFFRRGDVCLRQPRFFRIPSCEDTTVHISLFKSENHKRGRHAAGDSDLPDFRINRTSGADETADSADFFNRIHSAAASEETFLHGADGYKFRRTDIITAGTRFVRASAGQFRVAPPVVHFKLDRFRRANRRTQSAFITKTGVDALPLQQPETFL